MVTFPMETVYEHWTGSNDQVELTKGALLDNSEKGIVRLVFMAFDKLEEILQPQYDDSQEDVEVVPMSRTRKNSTKVLISKVISASLGKGKHKQLSEPVRIHFKHVGVKNVTNPSCVFWDYSIRFDILISYEM